MVTIIPVAGRPFGCNNTRDVGGQYAAGMIITGGLLMSVWVSQCGPGTETLVQWAFPEKRNDPMFSSRINVYSINGGT